MADTTHVKSDMRTNIPVEEEAMNEHEKLEIFKNLQVCVWRVSRTRGTRMRGGREFTNEEHKGCTRLGFHEWACVFESSPFVYTQLYIRIGVYGPVYTGDNSKILY
jgi:hypothetical protein